MYNGHKRTHAIKWQAVNAAIGLIVHLYGPVGKHNFKLISFNSEHFTPHVAALRDIVVE